MLLEHIDELVERDPLQTPQLGAEFVEMREEHEVMVHVATAHKLFRGRMLVFDLARVEDAVPIDL